MAVHFCPAFVVISLRTSLIKRSNSGVPGFASSPKIEQFRESASILKRTAFLETEGKDFSFLPVFAEPVNKTESPS